VKILFRFEFDDGEAACPVEGEQVEHAAVADGDGRNLRTEQIAAQAREQFGEFGAQARFKPALGLHAIERVGVSAVGAAALKKPGKHRCADALVLIGEGCLVGARAKCDLIMAGEGVLRNPVANACELKAVKKQAYFSRRLDVDLNPRPCRRWDKRQNSVDAGGATIPRGLLVKSMNKSRLDIAGIAKIDECELFAAFVQSVKLELCGAVVEPGDSLCGGTPRANGHNHLESSNVAAAIAFLAAMIEPENAEGENAIDDRRRFGLSNADDRIDAGA
jgi:hypothetical protein